MKTEKQTRKEIIDYRLKTAGWDCVTGSKLLKNLNVIEFDENL